MPSRLGRAWRSTLWRLAALAAVALALGWWLHAVPQSLLVVIAGGFAVGVFRFARLGRFLTRPQWLPPAEGSGIWDEIQNLLRRRRGAA